MRVKFAVTDANALQVLKAHQAWRLGAEDVPATDPKELTAALEVAIRLLDTTRRKCDIRRRKRTKHR